MEVLELEVTSENVEPAEVAGREAVDPFSSQPNHKRQAS